MRGRQVSRTARKEVDVVLVAVRSEPESDHLSIAQGYERRGAVWGDVQILERDAIIDRINQGKKVVIGRLVDLQGDFEVFGPVQLNLLNGENALYTGATPTKRDNLGIPLF